MKIDPAGGAGTALRKSSGAGPRRAGFPPKNGDGPDLAREVSWLQVCDQGPASTKPGEKPGRLRQVAVLADFG